MAHNHRYTIMENREGAEDRFYYATCKEAVESCVNPGEVVYRDSQIVKNAKTVKCYWYDLQDLHEALKRAKTFPDDFRAQVRAFLKAYKTDISATEYLALPASISYKLEELSRRY